MSDVFTAIDEAFDRMPIRAEGVHWLKAYAGTARAIGDCMSVHEGGWLVSRDVNPLWGRPPRYIVAPGLLGRCTEHRALSIANHPPLMGIRTASTSSGDSHA